MEKSPGKKKKEYETVKLNKYVTDDEVQVVEVLASCNLLDCRDQAYWRWKHLHRPGFMSWNIIKAHLGRKAIGCFHSAVLPVRIDEGLEINFCFCGDFAVLPQFRGLKLTNEAFSLIDNRLLQEGIFLRGGFSTPGKYEQVYKRFGEVKVPVVNTEYTKTLSLRPLQEKVKEMGAKILARGRLRRAFENEPLIVNVQIGDIPRCHLELTGRGFYLCEGYSEHAHLTLLAAYSLLVALKGGSSSLLESTVLSLFKGRLRIRGLLRNLPKLLAFLWSCIPKRS